MAILVDLKYCKHCNAEFPKTREHWQFQKAPDCADGIFYRCKDSVRKYQRTDARRAHQKEYRKTEAYKNAYTKYNGGTKAKVAMKKYKSSDKYKNSIHPMLSKIRTRLLRALAGEYRSGSAIRDLGCSIDEFKLYIENQFLPGMTWDNHGEWHFDHIQPLSKFDLSNKQEFLQAVNYLNIQPLWASDNISKGNK